jgi:hypothetical protein
VIYRLLIDTITSILRPDYGPVVRASVAEQLAGRLHRRTQRRARRQSTEAGWKRYGRHVYSAAHRRGHRIRLVRRKNPAPSQVVYRDAFQVAILPAKAR